MNKKNDQKLSDPNRITFKDFDKLNLKSFGEDLFQIIGKGVDSSVGEQGAYTISLNAEFGNGKTTFLEMFKHFIEDEKMKIIMCFLSMHGNLIFIRSL